MKRGLIGRAAPRTSALALGSALGLCLAVVGAHPAYAQQQGPPRTSPTERTAVPGSLLNRIMMANANHREAWENCDREAAHATLVQLYELVREAQRVSQAATGAGEFATIHPGDAADDYRVASSIYERARQRTFEECSQHDHATGALGPVFGLRPQTGTEPADQTPPIENVIDDMEITQEQILGPVVGRIPRTGEDASGETQLPELGPPLESPYSVPQFTIGEAPDSEPESAGARLEAETIGSAERQTRFPTPLAEIEDMRRTISEWIERMNGLYDHGNAERTLLRAFDARGVGWARRYADAWGNNGVYLRWDRARTWARHHLGALDSFRRDIFSRRGISADDLETLRRGMIRWRQTAEEISAALREDLEATAAVALELDRKQAGARNEAAERAARARVDRIRQRITDLRNTRLFSYTRKE